MIEKKINGELIKFDGLRHVKKGDLFRTVETNGNQGPWLKARHNAKQIPNPKTGKLVWSVKAPIVMEEGR